MEDLVQVDIWDLAALGNEPSFSRSRGNYANPSKVLMALNFMIERGDSLIVGILAADELLAWLAYFRTGS